MFYCDFCGKGFTRKFNLARHSRTKHSTANSDYRAKHLDTIEYSNTSNNNDHSSSDIANENNINNSSEDGSRNNESNNNNESLPLEVSNFIQEFPDKKDSFDQRILAATEAIKSKFNALRKSTNDFESKNPERKGQEDIFTKVIPENNDATVFEAKLPELLQCALDILMIKELQNIDTTDKNEENLDDEDGRTKFKRSYNTINQQENEDEINSREEIPLKRHKYDESVESENDDDISSINSECVVKKYWHNANSLVDELRKLISTTEIGQQISTILKSLMESNDAEYTNHYPALDKQRNELIRNLNELKKKTNIGEQIFCILHELEKAEIIESTDYVTYEKYDSDEEENNTVDVAEDLANGNRSYKTLSELKTLYDYV